RGVPVLLFPEGTRSEDGEVKAFKDGAFRLAISKSVPVIPIVLEGTGKTLAKNALDVSWSGDLIVHVLEPVQPQGFDGSVGKLRDTVRHLTAEGPDVRGGRPAAQPSPSSRAIV